MEGTEKAEADEQCAARQSAERVLQVAEEDVETSQTSGLSNASKHSTRFVV